MLISVGSVGGLLCMGCTTLINLPGVHVNVSETGVFIDVWGTPVNLGERAVDENLTGAQVTTSAAGSPP